MKSNLQNVVICFTEATCLGGEVNPPEENGLKLSH